MFCFIDGSTPPRMIFSYKGVYKYIDMLVSFVYDEVENSQNGRQLAGISKDGLTASYAYNDSGIRLRKTVNGVATQYFLNGSMIVAEVTGDVQTDYYYDESGNVFGFKRGDSEYYYIRNGQGDIIGILDSSGTQIVSYVYDSWGKLVSVTDASGNDKSGDASFIGNVNPIRYRGYYYDKETGWYYLNSRYYDPEVKRFINADSEISGANDQITGKNLFAYCFNNPVMLTDETGSWPSLGQIFATVATVAVATVAVAAVTAITVASLGTAAAIPVLVGAAVGGVTSAAVDAVIQYGDKGSIDAAEVIRAGSGGMITGAVSGSPAGKAAQVVTGAVTNVAQTAVDDSIAGEASSPVEYAVSAISGGFGGYIGGAGAQHIPTASATKIIHYTSMDSFAIFAPKVASQAATKSIIRSTGSGLISEGVLSIAENKVIELCP